jgi:formylglycine-generating enzyme required for sulfatase activity
MIGHVWEWTASPWTTDHGDSGADTADSCCSVSAGNGLGEHVRRVIKGGSHLCAPSYCLRYRPPARQGQEVRSSTSHIGFRCVLRDAT